MLWAVWWWLFLTYSEMVILVILFGLFVAVFSVTFFCFCRGRQKEKQWKWFAVVLVSWILGGGLGLFLDLFAGGRAENPRWEYDLLGESKQEVPVDVF